MWRCLLTHFWAVKLLFVQGTNHFEASPKETTDLEHAHLADWRLEAKGMAVLRSIEQKSRQKSGRPQLVGAVNIPAHRPFGVS